MATIHELDINNSLMLNEFIYLHELTPLNTGELPCEEKIIRTKNFFFKNSSLIKAIYMEKDSKLTAIHWGIQRMDSFHIMGLYISPQYRRQGLAKKLKLHLLGKLFPKMTVTTEVSDDNKVMLSLNNSLGFERVSGELNLYKLIRK